MKMLLQHLVYHALVEISTQNTTVDQ